MNTTTQAPPDETTALIVRFLEILLGDLQDLINHSADAAFIKHNTVLITGFVNGLGVACSASDYTGYTFFLDTLDAVYVGFKDLAKLKVATPDHHQRLVSTFASVAAGLAYYKARLADFMPDATNNPLVH